MKYIFFSLSALAFTAMILFYKEWDQTNKMAIAGCTMLLCFIAGFITHLLEQHRKIQRNLKNGIYN